MTDTHPYGLTDFERREEIGEPHCWQGADDVLVVEQRHEVHTDWVVTARFFVGGSGLDLVGLDFAPVSFYPWPPQNGLTTGLLRSVHIHRLYQTARNWLSVSQHVGIWFDVDESDFHRQRRPGRKGRSDLFYAQAAARYAELCGTTSSPTADLAKEMDISVSSARDLLHHARQRELLTPTKRGVARGHLTEKAIQLLRSENGDGQEAGK